MMGKTHRAAGIFLGLAISTMPDILIPGDNSTGTIRIIITTTGSALGSLLPDIDEPNSTIGRKLWFITWPIFILKTFIFILSCLIPEGVVKKALTKIDKETDHRHITHSLITWGFLSALLVVLVQLTFLKTYVTVCGFATGTIIGYLSHILLDMCSGTVPILGPFTSKRIGFPLKLSVNGIGEHLLRYGFVTCSAALIYNILSPINILP